jgi:hypothetical protein
MSLLFEASIVHSYIAQLFIFSRSEVIGESLSPCWWANCDRYICHIYNQPTAEVTRCSLTLNIEVSFKNIVNIVQLNLLSDNCECICPTVVSDVTRICWQLVPTSPELDVFVIVLCVHFIVLHVHVIVLCVHVDR